VTLLVLTVASVSAEQKFGNFSGPDVVLQDGSVVSGDKVNYKLVCLNDEFKCRDERLCVKAGTVCDGTPDCYDRSDEEACAYEQTCAEPLFKCENEDPLKCINPHWVCDGRQDCKDGSDESDCRQPLAHRPIASVGREFGDLSLRPTFETVVNHCNVTSEFRCDNGLCVPNDHVCDDISDCMDGSDEERVMCANKPCNDAQFTCTQDKNCIPKRWRCDGNPDCFDGSDEFNCHLGADAIASEVVCGENMFDCGSDAGSNTTETPTCVPMDKVCDGKEDCPTGTDESSTDCPESCRNKHCQSQCQQMPDGTEGFCTCPTGYQLNEDKVRCDDVDECATQYGVCSQLCKNTAGSFECSCADGYSMSGQSCKASGNVDPILFFSGKAEIRGLNLKTKKGFVVTKDRKWTKTAIGIAYDAKTDRVFWTSTENSKSRIISSGQDGADFEEVVSDLVMPESLAVDYVARNIYFSEPARDYLGVCNLDAVNGTRWCAQFHNKGVRQPREIALYIPKGLLFFTDWAHDMAKIQRVGMDGTHAETIVYKNLHWPNGVSVDAVLQRIYWSDAKHDLLESSKFDGSDRRQIEVTVIKHPFSLAVFEDRLFWSDWDLKKIQSCDKVTGQNREYLFNDTKIEPFGIHVYHPALEPAQTNPCQNRPCSHLCLLAHGGATFTCKCPDNMTLGVDERSCDPVPKPIRIKSRLGTFGAVTTTRATTITTTITTTVTTEQIENKIAPVMSQDMMEQRVKIGLVVGAFLLLILFCFLVACYMSYRKGSSPGFVMPALRYHVHKGQPFINRSSYQEQFRSESPDSGEDMSEIFVEKPSGAGEQAKSVSASDLTRTLEGGNSWQASSAKGGGQTGSDQSDDTDSKGFKLWRPNANRYQKF